MRFLFVLALCAAAVPFAPAQTKPATPRKATSPAATRSECVDEVGLCVSVPAGWQRLGDVFEGLGFVVAEPRPELDNASWPQLTVAAIDLTPEDAPPTTAPPSLDSLIDIVLTPDGSFTSAETVERRRLLIHGAEAEMVRVRLRDQNGKAEATEAVALIEGEEGLVYSIALRCPTQEFARLEPVFEKAAQSWRLQAPRPEAPAKTPPPSKAVPAPAGAGKPSSASGAESEKK